MELLFFDNYCFDFFKFSFLVAFLFTRLDACFHSCNMIDFQISLRISRKPNCDINDLLIPQIGASVSPLITFNSLPDGQKYAMILPTILNNP